MKLYKSLLPTVLLAALAVGAAPVEAAGGQRGGGGGFHGGGGSHSGGSFHGGGHAGGHNGFHGDRGFHDHGEFRGRHFDHGFGPGFRFRPRFFVGSGIFLGYPFDYPFYDPLDYWNYPVGPLSYVAAQGYGGVSFSISPGYATVTVDGAFAGTVDNFDTPESPLNLPPGQHHIQIQAAGYHTLDLDIYVQAGRVIPYAGDLQQQ
jgi:hypothetical protein